LVFEGRRIIMSKKLIFLVSFVFVLGVALTSVVRAADPDLVGWWRLNEGLGTTAADSSGQGNHGTLRGNPRWVAGKYASALQFDGVDDFVDIPHNEILTVDNEVTVMAWINAERYIGPTGDDWQGILAKGESPSRSYSFYTERSGVLHFSAGGYGPLSTGQIPLNEWVHVCAMVIGGQAGFYINGEPAGLSGTGIVLPGTADTATVVIGKARDANREFLGMIDDVRIYRRGLTQEEVQTAMKGQDQPYALGPSPADGAMHNDTWVTLSWTPGDFAVSHDIYLGDNFDDVNNGTHESETFRGNQGSLYFVAGFVGFPYPDGLVPGTTYYWRIDEVNDASAASPWKGDVWSFTVPSKMAYKPTPADGSKFIDAEAVILSWTKGFGTILNTVYFGDDFDTVANATGGLPVALTTYDPGALEPDKSYFWRVDEFDGAATHKGDVWSFKTMPYITITDPNLVGWWKLDEGSGVTVLDGSGHGNHGTLKGDPQWVVGHDDDALEFDGVGDYVEVPHDASLTVDTEVTVMAWIYAERYNSSGGDWQAILAKSNDPRSYSFYTYVNGTLHFSAGASPYVGSNSTGQVPLNEWAHVCAMVVDGHHQFYINGEDAGTGGSGTTLPGVTDTATFRIGLTHEGGNEFLGMIDDVRVYNKALTQDEIKQIMRGDPTLAWGPHPAHRSTPDIDSATPLSFSPGEKAAQHDVYFGTDKDAVENADASDTSGIYRNRQSGTSYTPPEGVEWGGGPYYWRIDEYNTDGTISKGNVWSFTVADFILVDDFEDYDAGDNQIWYAWHDGLGYGTPGSANYFAGNGTGSAIGDENTASYTEETIVNGGLQSMPLSYDNNKQGYAKYSEVELTLSSPRDWTQQDVAELSLWFRGYPVSAGSFVEAPVGTYTMTATGADIWTSADEFHYAFKMLTGAGSIVAKVLSVDNTDPWAKGGVMIRETLDAGSKFAAVYITPGNGCRFQARIGTNVDAISDTSVVSTQQTAITAPYWVKLERDISGSFRGYYSANGSTWTSMAWNPQYITMSSSVYIGLVLTSHNTGTVCEAKFSNVATTGTVSQQWTNQDIGISSNSAEPLYVTLSNKTGTPAVVYHDDPDATTTDAWTEWTISLQTFANQGINLTDVDRIAIGIGTRGNMTIPGGSGKMFFDDIRLYRPSEVAE
jgi:hypothetical protein